MWQETYHIYWALGLIVSDIRVSRVTNRQK